MKFLALGGCAYFFGTAEAHAASRVALAYDAATGCPSESEFQAAVEERGGSFTGPRAPGSAWALRVSIVQDGADFRGTLQATTDEATSTAREVHGTTCQEVANALAVVSATALNPQADSKATAKEESSPPPAAKAPVTAPTSPAAAAVAEGRLRATGSVNNAKVPVEAGTLRFDKARILSVFGGAQYGRTANWHLKPKWSRSRRSLRAVLTPPRANARTAFSPAIRAIRTLRA